MPARAAPNKNVPDTKLGRMYEEVDGVPHNDLRAFEYFSQIANGYADDNPGTAQARSP